MLLAIGIKTYSSQRIFNALLIDAFQSNRGNTSGGVSEMGALDFFFLESHLESISNGVFDIAYLLRSICLSESASCILCHAISYTLLQKYQTQISFFVCQPKAVSSETPQIIYSRLMRSFGPFHSRNGVSLPISANLKHRRTSTIVACLFI